MTDNREQLTCPACEEEMTKVLANGVNIDICLDGCGSIYFDNRELKKFDDAHDNIEEILEAIKDKSFETVDGSKTRVCPVCKIPMVKMGAGVDGVQIDVCNLCGAKFLDNGELLKIREGNEDNTDKEALMAKINMLYQKDLEKVLGPFANISATTPSARQQFFAELAYNIITK